MAARISLRDYQRELAARLQSAASRHLASKLGLQVGEEPWLVDLAEAAEAEGFFFSGIGPLFAPDGDVLRLQYLRSPLDPTLLQIYSPFARELLDYVIQERQRVGG